MIDVTCRNCGAVYSLTEYHIPARDKDELKCNHCGARIYSWNGSAFYSAEEIHGPTKRFKKKE